MFSFLWVLMSGFLQTLNDKYKQLLKNSVYYKEIFNSKSIYNNLTNYGRNDLDKTILIDYFLNIDDGIHISKLEDKEIYTLQDLKNLDLENKEILI